MSQVPFSADWLKQFSDPYAVLGLSVTADDRRALKRYRNVAKLLHPDSLTEVNSERRAFATQLFARLVNPAYQKLKQEKGRSETLAMLRFRVRRLTREEPISPRSEVAHQLLSKSLPTIDTFYEQAVTDLAESQYQPLQHFEAIATQLEELNLVYLRLKMGEPMIREKRTGIIAAKEAKPIEFAPVDPSGEKLTVNYAQRHYMRAQEYMKRDDWTMAVQELRDAIRIEPHKSDFHAMLAKAYLMQNLPGMAKVHFRQALKFNPRHEMALEYARRLNIPLDPDINGTAAKETKGGGLFGLFAKKR
jgi:tetratricopeptide (TPR) repeat protein